MYMYMCIYMYMYMYAASYEWRWPSLVLLPCVYDNEVADVVTGSIMVHHVYKKGWVVC